MLQITINLIVLFINFGFTVFLIFVLNNRIDLFLICFALTVLNLLSITGWNKIQGSVSAREHFDYGLIVYVSLGLCLTVSLVLNQNTKFICCLLFVSQSFLIGAQYFHSRNLYLK